MKIFVLILVILIFLIVLFLSSKGSIEIRDVNNTKISYKIFIKFFNIIKIPIKVKSNNKINILKFLKFFKEHSNKLIIEKVHLNLSFGALDAILVAFTYSFINTLIPYILHNAKLPKKGIYDVNIKPYFDNNLFKISINCIFSIKLVHIIYIIYVFKGGRHGGTSDRRSYVNSHE